MSSADTREIALGVAGLGYWGPNLLRNFRAVPGCRVAAIADLDPVRLAEFARQYPDARTVASADELIADPAIDAIVLALPAALMPPLALAALDAGKHVLVEKPMAESLESGLRMARAAEAAGLVGMVDFTFVYSPPVQELHRLMSTGVLGPPDYYQSTRINLGRFQPDVDVVWDLVVHDVAILARILGRDPVSVSATGRGRLPEMIDTAHVTLSYEDRFQAFVHVSWLAPMKVRTAIVACRDGMVVYNDVDPDEKIRVYQVEEQFEPEKENPIVPTFRLGDVRIPRLPQAEPLTTMATAFVNAIREGTPPPTDWRFGTRVLAVLEAARGSLATGESVDLGSSLEVA